MPQILRYVILLAGLMLLAVSLYFNYINLTEAYGSGPPYYSQTTNMDKWASPLPLLAAIDIATIGVLLVLRWAYVQTKK